MGWPVIRRYVVEILYQPHLAIDPEDWMRAQGWTTMSRARQTGVDFQFVGTRGEINDLAVNTKEYHKYQFNDPKKARAFLLVWNGKRV